MKITQWKLWLQSQKSVAKFGFELECSTVYRTGKRGKTWKRTITQKKMKGGKSRDVYYFVVSVS